MNWSTRKKSDVDQKVAQELQNNKDFIYQTNQTLQGLSHGLISLSLSLEKLTAKSDSDRTYLHIHFENLERSVSEHITQMNQRLGDVETKLSYMCDDFLRFKEDVSFDYVKSKNFYEQNENTYEDIDELRKELITKTNSLNIGISTLKNLFKDAIDNVRKDLTPVPPKTDPLKQVDTKFDCLKVDMAGLTREIELLKKSNSYDQKKFENIYTLIERLKEGNK